MTKGTASFPRWWSWRQKWDDATEIDIKNKEETGREGTKQVALVSDTERKCMERSTLVGHCPTRTTQISFVHLACKRRQINPKSAFYAITSRFLSHNQKIKISQNLKKKDRALSLRIPCSAVFGSQVHSYLCRAFQRKGNWKWRRNTIEQKQNRKMLIKHPKMALDSCQCLGCKTRGVVTPQQLRLFAPHVFNMANGPCLKDGNATLHVVLTSMPYRC